MINGRYPFYTRVAFLSRGTDMAPLWVRAGSDATVPHGHRPATGSLPPLAATLVHQRRPPARPDAPDHHAPQRARRPSRPARYGARGTSRSPADVLQRKAPGYTANYAFNADGTGPWFKPLPQGGCGVQEADAVRAWSWPHDTLEVRLATAAVVLPAGWGDDWVSRWRGGLQWVRSGRRRRNTCGISLRHDWTTISSACSAGARDGLPGGRVVARRVRGP